MRTKLDAKTGVLILVAALLLAMITVIYAIDHIGIPAAMAPAGEGGITIASQGQVVGGFPRSLLLDPGAQVIKSFSTNYGARGTQYTAAWDTSSSMSSLYAVYLAYFNAKGWTVNNKIVNGAKSKGLYATDGRATVSVGFVATGTGTEVTATYLQQS